MSISVVMPARNAAATIGVAVDSVLSQTMPADEIIIVDDASTDRTAEIIDQYRNPLIRLIRNSDQRGIANSLNSAIQSSRGKFIARMDADDISHPNRFRRQADLLTSNPPVAVVGSWVSVIDRLGRAYDVLNLPIESASICGYTALSPPFRHPAVMMRRAAIEQFKGPYDPDAEGAEDYDLWARLLPVHQARNIPERLLAYRMHKNSVTGTRGPKQVAAHAAASRRYAEMLLDCGDLDNVAFQLIAKAVVLGATIDQAELVTICDALQAINLALEPRLGTEQVRSAMAEQQYILLKVVLRTEDKGLCYDQIRFINRRYRRALNHLGTPLWRDVRRVVRSVPFRIGSLTARRIWRWSHRS